MRLYNPGTDGAPPLHYSGETPEVAVPAMFCPTETALEAGADGKPKVVSKIVQQYVEHKPGAVYLSMPGIRFQRVDKGGWFDVPPGMTVEAVKALAPCLMTETEVAQQKGGAAKPAAK